MGSRDLELYGNAGEDDITELFRCRITFYRSLFLLTALSSMAAALLLFFSLGSSALIPALLLIFLPVIAYWRYYPRVILREYRAVTEAKRRLGKRGEAKTETLGIDTMMLQGYEGYLQALKEMVKRRE
ncbi:hypothetical protein [Candidatus Pyrohabitans sp.]